MFFEFLLKFSSMEKKKCHTVRLKQMEIRMALMSFIHLTTLHQQRGLCSIERLIWKGTEGC